MYGNDIPVDCHYRLTGNFFSLTRRRPPAAQHLRWQGPPSRAPSLRRRALIVMPGPLAMHHTTEDACHASSRRAELCRYFAVEQPQPLAQVHVPLQAQSSPHVQRARLAAQPHEVV